MVGVTLDYLSIYLYREKNGQLVKLADTLPFLKPSITVSDSKVRKDLEAYLLEKIEDDEHDTRLFHESRIDITVYVFQKHNVYFYMLLNLDSQYSINVQKVNALYKDLKKDITAYARGDLRTLQATITKDLQLQKSL
jgi:hypothetical protein